ncbi:MAG: hypothetical protein AB8B59_05865 [Maribacter sp.]
MKNLQELTNNEQKELNGGGFARKHRHLTIEDWNPNIGWEGSGPGGQGIFPG